MKTGLVSISFRKLSAEQVIDLVHTAGLDGIEWGGDIHAPHGDVQRAEEIGRRTREAGLAVACYGSYWRAANEREAGPEISAVIDSAAALGAPLIRVWAGTRASKDADASYFERVVGELAQFTQQASAAGIRTVLEYHAHTLTDTCETTHQLLERIPEIYTLWQPPVGVSCEKNQADLSSLLLRVENLHVYSWATGADGRHARLPLKACESEWQTYFKLAAANDRYALMEFVKDDSEEQFVKDATDLKRILSQ